MAEMSPLEKWFVNRANPWIYRRVLEPFFRHGLSLPAAPALLELGCGTGQAALIAYQLYRPARFVVTDFDLSQVERARATFDRAYGRVPEVLAFETADAMRLRYPDASFDAVFAFLVLHHLAEPRAEKTAALLRGLREIHRVLKPRGRFVYAEIFQRRIIRDYFGHEAYEVVHHRNLLLADLAIIRKPAIADLGAVA